MVSAGDTALYIVQQEQAQELRAGAQEQSQEQSQSQREKSVHREAESRAEESRANHSVACRLVLLPTDAVHVHFTV